MSEQDLNYRRRFEALLSEALKAAARKPMGNGGKAIPEIPTTFREGFKFALVVMGVVDESTTELNDKQMQILNDKMHEMLHLPPPPSSPDDYVTDSSPQD